MMYNTHFLSMCFAFHAERLKNLDIFKEGKEEKTAIAFKLQQRFSSHNSILVTEHYLQKLTNSFT
jgi:hypothetical protein